VTALASNGRRIRKSVYDWSREERDDDDGFVMAMVDGIDKALRCCDVAFVRHELCNPTFRFNSTQFNSIYKWFKWFKWARPTRKPPTCLHVPGTAKRAAAHQYHRPPAAQIFPVIVPMLSLHHRLHLHLLYKIGSNRLESLSLCTRSCTQLLRG
jgi:hypothetical protein